MLIYFVLYICALLLKCKYLVSWLFANSAEVSRNLKTILPREKLLGIDQILILYLLYKEGNVEPGNASEDN